VVSRETMTVSGPVAGNTFARYLTHTLGGEYRLVVHVGSPARPNRKPVVQLLGQRDEPLGFAKLGTSTLSRRLVRAESGALRRLSATPLRHVTVPTLVHTGAWNGHEVMVQSALPVWRAGSSGGNALMARAMIEVATCTGTHRERLAESGYWATLRARLHSVEAGASSRQVSALAHRLVEIHGGAALTYGAWHGDWSAWNMRPLGSSLLVWDWERFASGVPLGFDALHQGLQPALLDDDKVRACRAWLRKAPQLLSSFDVGTHEATLTGLLYLLELATRQLADEPEKNAAQEQVSRWLVPVLAEGLGADSAANRAP
jgi:hypothetical protein